MSQSEADRWYQKGQRNRDRSNSDLPPSRNTKPRCGSEETCKTISSPNCSLQFTAASLPTAVPKGPIQLRSEFVNPSNTPHVRIVTARIVHRTLNLSRKSCQALERYIRLGLCCTLETEVSQGQGWPNPGKKCWDFEGIKAAAVGHGAITDQPYFRRGGFSQLHGPKIV